MRLWFVVPVMDLGGSERHLVRLAAGLRASGVDARILEVFREGVLKEDMRKAGIPSECLNAGRGWGVSTFVRLWRWMKSAKIDVLHTYLFGFHLYAGLPARMLGVPVVLSSRREIAKWQKTKHLLLERLGNLCADKVVCCSKAARDWAIKAEKLVHDKTAVIHNGLDWRMYADRTASRETISRKVREEFQIPEGAPVVGTVANLAVEKGYPHLLEAAGAVLKKFPDTRFLLVGFGKMEAELKKRASEINAEERIIFTGKRSDVPDLLQAMDVFVLASLIEGFPNALLEAMASSRAVIATRTGGIPELIENGLDGLLVPVGSSGALADKICALIKNSDMRNALGQAARLKIERDFSPARMVEDYKRLYREQLKLKGRVHFSSKDSSNENRKHLTTN